MSNKVLVFGEMLWDCLPQGDVPGGASMNVALHLHIMGFESRLISAVGKDNLGKKLLKYFKSYGASDELIQINEHETSRVLVDNSDIENVKYNIISPVAWDFIENNPLLTESAKNCDAFVFGTLGVRNHQSLQTLLELLHHAELRIFDANLRPPYYDFEVIETLLGFTEILKINEDELVAFGDYFNIEAKPEPICEFLDKHFPIETICITLGSKGALIYQDGKFYSHPGYSVKVVDTIGAGDAFLSGFVKSHLDKSSPEKTLDFACKVGAYVASKQGGSPKYKLSDLDNLKRK
ncbi:PfkB family carbohydrate kinase [Algoriphagus limi]|uniref:PfkB family carbohydrate kinase n=1 Tax=Algoriphagus limi TaxID=2975273 RepID=A0ABT2G5G7_9BACT|nr:PfkB family carbohydrate kinase [Algoriphagus limi]MCS5489696.1 PfkB family carbohydrate kinase [Algoriphagus limi]